MALATDKIVFLHVPKTGGIWIKNALNSLGLNPIEIGTQHDSFPELFNSEPREFFENKLVFTFIRHPVFWYQSRWAFRIKHGWQSRHPLDFNCASNDFLLFVDKALSYKPDGWCSWLFERYISKDTGLVDKIGRTENLVGDFIDIMREAGHDVDEQQVRDFSFVNSSDMDGFGSKYWAKYSEELLDRVMVVEDSIISRYYHDFPIDPKTLCGSRNY